MQRCFICQWWLGMAGCLIPGRISEGDKSFLMVVNTQLHKQPPHPSLAIILLFIIEKRRGKSLGSPPPYTKPENILSSCAVCWYK